jgi:peroxiredoxin Q/BCP
MGRRPEVLVAIVCTAVGCQGVAQRPDGERGPLPIGAVAPEVVGYDADGREVRLSEQRGHPSVVYFYPRDGTPGCTKEACAFRDAWARFEQAHVAVIGVSANSREDHDAFLRGEHLPFALVADGPGVVAAGYGVRKGLFGDERVTFLIDGEGRVARYWPDVDPAVHATEVLAAAQAVH